MRFVALKSEEQLDIPTLHRVHSRLAAARRTLLNQLRALLLERGHTFPLEVALGTLLEDPAFALSRRIRELVLDMRAEWHDVDRWIAALNAEFVELAR